MSEHKDKYEKMSDLLIAERRGRDYEIIKRAGRTGIAVIAPHGGAIESGTCKIADAVAASDHAFYSFRGIKSAHNFRDLHVTSTHFDEPECIEVIKTCQTVIAIHGCKDRKGMKDNDRMVFFGGLNGPLAKKIEEHLKAIQPKLSQIKFDTGRHSDPLLQGTDTANVCNQGQGKRGVQLELTKTLRSELISKAAAKDLDIFIEAIRQAIAT